MIARFVIEGDPKGKERPRVTKSGFAYTPKQTVIYENLVKLEYKRQCGTTWFPKETALDVRIAAYYPIPSSKPKKTKKLMEENSIRPIKKPDCDNVIKAILDSLNQIAYYDDTQVVDLQIRKFYSQKPRVVVTIKEATPITLKEN